MEVDLKESSRVSAPRVFEFTIAGSATAIVNSTLEGCFSLLGKKVTTAAYGDKAAIVPANYGLTLFIS